MGMLPQYDITTGRRKGLEDSPPAVSQARSRDFGKDALRWLPPFLFVLAAVAEILSMLLVTIFRYHNQMLGPELFDLSKTPNVLGTLLALPFILLFLLFAASRRFHRIGLSSTAAAIATAGVVLLTAIPLIPVEKRSYYYLGYLALKVLELALFIVLARPARRRTPLRRIVSIVLSAIGIVVATTILVISTVLLSPASPTILEQTREEFDAAVILGAAVWSGDKPSPVLRERINTGYDLLQNGTVQFLVLTGGNAPNELPEAEVARRELLKRGVDPTRIVQETHTHSTLEQILYIREHLLKQGWSSFIIVSDQFHLKRALEICAFNGIDARGVSSESPLGPQNLAIYHLRESVALILYWMFGV
jgi:vancomycin permeability regulator SanA